MKKMVWLQHFGSLAIAFSLASQPCSAVDRAKKPVDEAAAAKATKPVEAPAPAKAVGKSETAKKPDEAPSSESSKSPAPKVIKPSEKKGKKASPKAAVNPNDAAKTKEKTKGDVESKQGMQKSAKKPEADSAIISNKKKDPTPIELAEELSRHMPVLKSGWYYLVPHKGTSSVLSRGNLLYKVVKKGISRVKFGDTILLQKNVFGPEPKLFLIDYKNKGIEIAGEMEVVVGRQLFKSPQSVRTVFTPEDFTKELDNLPKTQSVLRKMLSYTLGASKYQIKESKKVKARRFPIIPFAPDKVITIEAKVFPVSVALSWPILQGQQDPHSVYLWRKGEVASTPFETVTGGGTTLLLSEYGTYYWQIVDDSTRFESSPRTIVVREATKKLVKDPAIPKKNRLEELPFYYPHDNAIQIMCLNKGKKEVFLSIGKGSDNVNHYRIKVEPKGEVEKFRVQYPHPHEPIGADRVYLHLTIRTASDFRVRVLGYTDKKSSTPIASTSYINLSVKNFCGNKAVSRVWSDLGKSGTRLPDQGQIIFGSAGL